MNPVLSSILFSLGMTLVIETVLAALLGVRGWDLVIIGLVNCLTNPVVNFLYDCVWLQNGGQGLLPAVVLAALEIAVLFGEALLFKKLLNYRKIRPFWLSLILNGTSFAVGEIIVWIGMLLK